MKKKFFFITGIFVLMASMLCGCNSAKKEVLIIDHDKLWGQSKFIQAKTLEVHEAMKEAEQNGKNPYKLAIIKQNQKSVEEKIKKAINKSVKKDSIVIYDNDILSDTDIKTMEDITDKIVKEIDDQQQ